MPVKFSIIVCTYNPDVVIFTRLLNSIILLSQGNGPSFEVIIVDNNSKTPIADIPAVKNMEHFISNFRLLIEKKAGLTNARITGIKNSKYNWIIFFDDDNEPEYNYLSSLTCLIKSYPDVVCWGAGKINVHYIGKIENQWMKKVKPYFQQRTLENIYISGDSVWTEASPYGTGMGIKKDVLFKYIEKVEKGFYTLSDRKGRSLSSGGDIQIIFTAIAIGSKVGSSPCLAVNHLIKSEKANLNYLCKLSYGTASSYLLAYNQVFTDNPIPINTTSNYEILKLIYYTFRTAKGQNKFKDFLIRLSKSLGEVNARYAVNNLLKRPFLLIFFEKTIRY
jgi:glycosyltransferase involved in cell wall biosynthesis